MSPLSFMPSLRCLVTPPTMSNSRAFFTSSCPNISGAILADSLPYMSSVSDSSCINKGDIKMLAVHTWLRGKSNDQVLCLAQAGKECLSSPGLLNLAKSVDAYDLEWDWSSSSYQLVVTCEAKLAVLVGFAMTSARLCKRWTFSGVPYIQS